MILIAIVMFVAGIIGSAYFSGAETGFYRATRVRMALDSMSGDRVANGLLKFVNDPAKFVATTLIGNNVANFLTSHSIVLGTRWLLGMGHSFAEVIIPIILAPIVFVYCELLPKNLFYLAPNRLLRQGGRPFMLFAILVWPLAIVLRAMALVLQQLGGQPPERVRLRVARNELEQMLEEGREIGILQSSQREMTQAVFDCSSLRVSGYSLSPRGIPKVNNQQTIDSVLRFARRAKTSELLVTDQNTQQLIGYVPVFELYLAEADSVEQWSSLVRPLIKLNQHRPLLDAVSKLQATGHPLAQVVDQTGKPLGIVFERDLMEPILV